MIPPAIAAWRWLAGWLMGLGLGLWYGFLRPLRPRFTALSDGIFCLGLLGVWTVHSFGICAGEMHVGYLAAMGLGAYAWEWAFGPVLGPLFGRIWGIVLWPVKKISVFTKILFAYMKKWVTIRWNNRRHNRRIPGGESHGKERKSFQPH